MSAKHSRSVTGYDGTYAVRIEYTLGGALGGGGCGQRHGDPRHAQLFNTVSGDEQQ
jgi:hypothetical protein